MPGTPGPTGGRRRPTLYMLSVCIRCFVVVIVYRCVSDDKNVIKMKLKNVVVNSAVFA